MKNYLQLELGGKLRGLKFNIGTLHFIQELTGTDPFEFQAASTSFNDLIPYVTHIVHAALLSNCASKKEDPDFTGQNVDEWVNDMNVPILTDIVALYNAIIAVPKATANGEVGANTQTNV